MISVGASIGIAAGIRLWYPPDAFALAIDVSVLVVWGFLIGHAFARLPPAHFARDGALTRLRPWEHEGNVWNRVGVRRWKGRLPDAGGFGGGVAKATLARRDPRSLQRFVVETRRAELVHWFAPAISPVFYLWNPWWLATVMVAYGIIANVPCLVTQRYNRGRLLRILAKDRARSGGVLVTAGSR